MEIRGYRVFYLDPEEDINSLLAELGQSSAQKMALVVHRRSNIFNSKINIQLLERYLKDWKKELVFISPEERLIRMALESKLKIYPDLEALDHDEPITDLQGPLVTSLPTEVLAPEIVEKQQPLAPGEVKKEVDVEDLPMYRTSRRRKKSWLKRIGVAVFIFTVLLGGALFFLSFPLVTVEVSPSVEKLEKSIQVIGDVNIDQIRLVEGRVPAQAFKSYDVKADVKIPVTGRKTIGHTRSEGVALFINKQTTTVSLPEGTVLKTSNGIKFKTTQVVTVPPLKAEYERGLPIGSKYGQAEVGIVALEPGSQGNVDSGRVNTFDGKNFGLQVSNLDRLTGGSDREEPIVTQRDLDSVVAQLEKKLKEFVLADLAKTGDEYLCLQDTLQFKMSNVEVSHSVDESTQELQAKGQMVATGYLLMKDDLRLVTRETFLADLPASYQLYSRDIQIDDLQTTMRADGAVQVKMKASAFVRASIEPQTIAEQLKGQTIEYANSLLSKMKDIKYFRIVAGDNTRIPRLPFAIRVVIREPEGGEKGSI